MLHVGIMMAPSAVLVMKDTMEMELILVKVSKHYYTTWLNVRSHVLDTNECDADPCVMNAACENTDGSFSCSCFEGFNGNGIILCEGELTLLISGSILGVVFQILMSATLILVLRMLHVITPRVPSAVHVMKDLMEMELYFVKVS